MDVEINSMPVEVKIPCVYNYSAWGACVGGKKTRAIISRSPFGCDAAPPAEPLIENCDSENEILPSRQTDAPMPAPESMMMAAQTAAPENFNGRTSAEWQKYYFGAPACNDAAVCAGNADSDNDGLNNNDEYRFGTHPNSADTDRDGRVDGDEVRNGLNPLLASTATSTDAVVYENPKTKGKQMEDIYQVTGIDYASTTQKLTIKGKALPDIYATVYLYSEEPVILTIKTDSEGNWIHIIDKPADGAHEVYLVVNENDGGVIAKSAPFAFVQTAQAASPLFDGNPVNMEKAVSPVKARLQEGYLIFIGSGLAGLVLALAIIGLMRNIGASKKE